MPTTKRIVFINQGQGESRKNKKVAMLKNLQEQEKCSLANTKREDIYPFYLMPWSK